MFQVMIARDSVMQLEFQKTFDTENQAGGEYSALFRGFLHPLETPPAHGNDLKVYLVVQALRAELNISINESIHGQVKKGSRDFKKKCVLGFLM